MDQQDISRKRIITTTVFLLFTSLLFYQLPAQDQTSSPYSRFGIGDLLSRNYGRGAGMGGLGTGLSERNNLNLLNPAGIGSMDTLQFIFELGLSDKVTWLSTTNLERTTNNVSFDYLGMGFPITSWWKGSVGIAPYSGIGYRMADAIDDPVIGQVSTEFTGEGGVSRFFIQQAIRPVKYVSLGVTFSYLFGPLSHTKTLIFPADSTYFSTRSNSTAIVGGIHMSYGAQFHIPLKNNYFVNLGGTFENRTDVRTESRQLVYSSGQGMVDTLLYIENPDNLIGLPMGYAGGISFGKPNKFTIGADYRVQNWGDATFLGQRDSLANSQEIVVGMEYIPDALSPLYFYKRMSYRAGVRYAKSYIQLRETQLNDFGITFGIGIPVRSDRVGRPSSLNISAEIGKRGTVDNDLISEMYGLVSVQFSLRDFWFIKSKYD